MKNFSLFVPYSIMFLPFIYAEISSVSGIVTSDEIRRAFLAADEGFIALVSQL